MAFGIWNEAKSAGPTPKASKLEPSEADAVKQEPWIPVEADLVVVGGGLAGICAAISAARHGIQVALVHNRPMLGGNSSSEVRLYPEDTDYYHPWIKEGGILDELHVEERKRNHWASADGRMNCHWDLVLYEWILREPKIRFFLNTHVYEVQVNDTKRIQLVRALQFDTEKSFEFRAPLFLDSTGDGVLARKAGADFALGREGTGQYGELLAPEQPDHQTMGNSLYYKAIDMGKPIPFECPDWAVRYSSADELRGRSLHPLDAGHWWMEIGVPYDPIRDNDQIRHELLRRVLGVWDLVKNKRTGAENLALEYVGFVPYKREGRRILGDIVLTQEHVQNPAPLPDAVAYGGWWLDIHAFGGVLALEKDPAPDPKLDWDRWGTQVYPIPLRALYSRNIPNLLMAGRPISCSYVAFSATRVLATCALAGQAAGVAAALSIRYKTLPRTIARERMRECQHILLRDDVFIPGLSNEDPRDLARAASTVASSETMLTVPEGSHWEELTRPLVQIFPVSTARVRSVSLFIESRRAEPVRLKAVLKPAVNVWDFGSTGRLAHAEVEIPPRVAGWIEWKFDTSVKPGGLCAIEVGGMEGVQLRVHHDQPGTLGETPVAVSAARLTGTTRWLPLTGGQCFAMRVDPQQHPYSARNAVEGANRPDRWSNIWISDPGKSFPAWLELRWPQPVTFQTVQITFDTDVNRRSVSPLFRYPECVRDYSIQARDATLAEVNGNYFRRRIHNFAPTTSDVLRLIVTATNGAPSARVYEIRVYEDGA